MRRTMIGLALFGMYFTAAVSVSPAASAATPQATTGQNTVGKPGFTLAGGHSYVGWTGTDLHLNIAEWDGSNIFGHNTISADTAQFGTGPALGTKGTQVYVAWEGTNSNHNIFMAHYNGTGTLDCRTQLSDTTFSTPSLTQDSSGNLWLAWVGRDAAHHLNVARVNVPSCPGGQMSLSSKVMLNDASPAGPGIASFNGSLYLAWSGTDAGHHIWTGRFTGSPTLANHTQTPEGSADDIGLVGAPSDGREWLTYHGTDGRVYDAFSSDGTTFPSNQNQQNGDTTNEGVGAGYNGNMVWELFAGTDTQLNITCIFC